MEHHNMVSQDPRQDGRPSPSDFDIFLPWACKQLMVDANIIITRSFQSHYESALVKDKPKHKSKPKGKYRMEFSSESDESSESVYFDKGLLEEDKPIYVEAVYDEDLNIVQVKFLKNRRIPREIMKIISLILPFHRKLTSLSLKTGVHAELIYEISRFLPTSHITELCLDFSYVPQANYHILLDNTVLKHLSLAKCSITDDVVKNIVSKLDYESPAGKTLSALNLSTNIITDVGASYIADALRSNRHLCYLNLADNRITDTGASSIFDVLQEFSLTEEETLDRNSKLMDYMKTKHQFMVKTVYQLQSGGYEIKKEKKKSIKPTPALVKRKTSERDFSVHQVPTEDYETNYFERAEIIARATLGSFKHPFALDKTEMRDNVIYSLGNNTLGYLNLAYNNLSYASLKKLCRVLISQNILNKYPKGLIKVRIEGNCLPQECPEWKMIDNLLQPAGLNRQLSDSSRRKLGRLSKRGI